MGNTVDMNGWHTVAAVSYAHVNAAIVEQDASPKAWSYAASDGSASVAGGTFGTWALAVHKGASGGGLMIEIPLTGGTLTVGANPLAIPNCTATVRLSLEFIPQPSQPAGLKMDLRVQPASTSTDPVAAVEDLQPPLPGFLNNAVLKQLLQEWLNANLGEFNAIFATVDLGAEFATEGTAWMGPSWHGYAVAEKSPAEATLQNSVFAVLCLIDGETDTTGLVDQVSPYAIPPGADAGFLISPKKVLEHMMMPAMPLMFKGIQNQLPSLNFAIDNDGTRIRSIKDLTMNDFTMPDGHKVTDGVVKAGLFTLQVDGTELEFKSEGIAFTLPIIGISGGFDVKLNYSGRNTVSLDTQHDILTLTSTTQTGSGSVAASEGLEIAEIAAGVMAVLASIVSFGGGQVAKAAERGVATATAVAVSDAVANGERATVVASQVPRLLSGIVTGDAVEVAAIGARFATVGKIAMFTAGFAGTIPLIGSIAKAVAAGDYEDCPKISNLASSAVGKAVIWPQGVPDFELASAELNGALQFGLKATA